MSAGWAVPAPLGACSCHGAGWLWSFDSIGMALQFLHSRQRVLGYWAVSAYWVYRVLVPVLLKIAINVAVTTAVCVGTYHRLTRYTRERKLLNGKRHPR